MSTKQKQALPFWRLDQKRGGGNEKETIDKQLSFNALEENKGRQRKAKAKE